MRGLQGGTKVKIILASKSPRRSELLSKIVKDFEIITVDVDESLPEGVSSERGVELLAVKKGEAVSDLVGSDAMVISSDTLVELDGVALGKPKDRNDAYAILSSLSGKCHNVHTGVAVHLRGKVYSGTHTSRVYFRNIKESEIYEYIDTGEPMDKAGAYGIQGGGGAFVEKFDGEFESIMGLSLTLTRALMDKALGDNETVL